MEFTLEEPLMLPPVTLQLYVLPATVVTEYVAPVNLQTELGPVITGVGYGIKVTLNVTVESHPNELVWVTVTEPEAKLPQDMLTELVLEGPLMLPPVAVHT